MFSQFSDFSKISKSFMVSEVFWAEDSTLKNQNLKNFQIFQKIFLVLEFVIWVILVICIFVPVELFQNQKIKLIILIALINWPHRPLAQGQSQTLQKREISIKSKKFYLKECLIHLELNHGSSCLSNPLFYSRNLQIANSYLNNVREFEP